VASPDLRDPAWLDSDRKNEPLLPELEACLVEGGPFGLALKHPLVYDIPFIPILAYRANDQYRAKQEELRKALERRDFHTYIWLHERPYRQHAFSAIRPYLVRAPKTYWKLLGEVWCDSENLWQWTDLRRLWSERTHPGRSYVMTADERRALSLLPGPLTVYRGYRLPRGTREGWSWTTDQAKAEWFARRLLVQGDKPMLVSGTLPKVDVIAYFTRRGESEVVAAPRSVKDTHAQEISRQPAS
jgi:hypothetical protein